VSADSEERVITANSAAEAILGAEPGTLVGRSVLDFIHPADREVLRAQSARRQTGEKNTYELRIIRGDGTARILQVTATPLLDPAGKFQSSLGILRDVTADRLLRHRVNLLAHTVESVDECVSICGPDDRLIFVNRAFLRTYGYTEQELIGQNVAIVRSPLNPLELTAQILPATLAGGWHGELWNRRKGGSDFQIMLTTAAVADEKGNLEATVGVARDITNRKREEAELRRAKEEAESASRAKSEFLATMSHEIRTPMNGVIGMTGLLLDTTLTPEQREYAETVRNSADALLTVINDILDFSKMEAGKLQVESFPFDLRLVMEEVSEMLAPRADEKHVSLVLEYASSYPRHFLADGGRVRQVVTNLVGNAVKFTPAGDVFDCRGVLGARLRFRVDADFGERHGGGYSRRPDRLTVREVQPGGWFHDPEIWRHGFGARDRQAAYGTDGGPHFGGEPVGRRLHFLRGFADAPRSATAHCSGGGVRTQGPACIDR
jgi:PAS domain S-box-containing protein